ncbi:4-alpha-N-acetylgalactosaminyltransferase [Rubripirellula amarantea]|uniref:4-alpha-N-acetylgalactosaminyltransferase n=2 Tax=Rubripirellula amarantea TaxID=2527999 RepID=A0A5C5WUA4_9BACT|nr:4-alpha-N-acetylgalactosaminyltransferase [Rubripirellula amarantea]
MISSMRGGGSERQTLLLLKHLDRQVFEPHLYMTEAEGCLLAEVPQDVVIHSYQPSDAASGFYFPGRILRDQTRHLLSVLDAARIDVIYDRTFHMTMLAGSAATSRSIPRVSTIVSPPERAVPMVEKRFVQIKKRRLAKAYRQSTSVIAVSQQAAASAVHYYGLSPEDVVVVANPVDVDEVTSQSAASVSVSRSANAITFICVGRMTAEKGQRNLIEALSLLESDTNVPSLEVWFVGDGPLRVDVENLARRTLSRHQVRFLGHQDNAPAWIASADALILPSLFEGMPNVVLEAMAIGKPVIATRAGGTVELQRDEPTMFMAEPGNPTSIAAAIRTYCDNPELIEQHVDAAKRLIDEHHNISKNVNRIETIMKDAANLRRT